MTFKFISRCVGLLSVCSYYGIEFYVKFNSAKSNAMVFCCNLLKDIPIPNFMLNDVAIDKVSNCKYRCTEEPRFTVTSLVLVAKWLRAWDTLTMFEATVCGRP